MNRLNGPQRLFAVLVATAFVLSGLSLIFFDGYLSDEIFGVVCVTLGSITILQPWTPGWPDEKNLKIYRG
jgi:hypothetical protein